MLDRIIHLLTEYKYYVLFPLAIVEGPIIAVLSGLLCLNGFLQAWLVYPILIAGDMIGDSACYWLGRWGKKMGWIGRRLGLQSVKIDRVRGFIDTHPVRTISLSKVTLGVGVAGIFMAGNARVPYPKFVVICLATSAVQDAFYLSVGLLFGHAYVQIGRYLDYFAAACIVTCMAIVLFFAIKSLFKKI
jgi:membrane-associated protein